MQCINIQTFISNIQYMDGQVTRFDPTHYAAHTFTIFAIQTKTKKSTEHCAILLKSYFPGSCCAGL